MLINFSTLEMFNGYEWQGHRLEVAEGRYIDRSNGPAIPIEGGNRDSGLPLPPAPINSSRAPPPPLPMIGNTYQPESTYPPAVPPPTATIISPTSVMPPAVTEAIPPPPPHYQNIYKYGAPDAAVPPPPHMPPPPPMYTQMSLVGGPAANLPTHGHNQIFVNNVRESFLRCDMCTCILNHFYIVAIFNNVARFN
jgi:hypothetical protein